MATPRIEVWNYTAFARHLYEHGVDVVRGTTAQSTVEANFTGIKVVEDSKLGPRCVSILTADGKRVDIKL